MLRTLSSLRVIASALLMALAMLVHIPAANADWRMDLATSTVGKKVIKAIIIHEGKELLAGVKTKGFAAMEKKVRQNPWMVDRAEKSLNEAMRSREVHSAFSTGQLNELNKKFEFRRWGNEGMSQSGDF